MNKIVMIIVIILAIICIIHIFTLQRHKNSRCKNNKSKLPKYKDIKHTLKTGDILLFGYRAQGNIFEKFMYLFRTKFAGCDFGHVGLIMKFDDELYLLETVSDIHDCSDKATYLNNKGNGGVRFVKLETILSEYSKNHDACYGIKYISQELDSNDIFELLNKYKHKEFSNRYILSLVYVLDLFTHAFTSNILKNIFDKNVTTCTEFVYDLLSDLNVIKNKYPSKLFWPHHFNDKHFNKFCKKYSKTYEFSYDLSAVNQLDVTTRHLSSKN